MRKKNYYAYFVPDGRDKFGHSLAQRGGGAQGVTDDWKKCEKMVSGRPGARFKAFSGREEAERWLRLGAVYEPKAAIKHLLEPGIYFDAGTGRGEGVEISVTDEKGKNLLHKALSRGELNRFGKHLVGNPSATNNYGELLALKYAIQLAQKAKIKKVFGDSKLVIEYWSKWRVKRKDLPVETVELADEVASMREEFEANGGSVDRIPGGHNPADLGFHR